MSNEIARPGKLVDANTTEAGRLEIRQLDPMKGPPRFTVKQVEIKDAPVFLVLDATLKNAEIRRFPTRTEATMFIGDRLKKAATKTPDKFFVWNETSTVAVASFDTLTEARNYIGKVISHPQKLTVPKSAIKGPSKGSSNGGSQKPTGPGKHQAKNKK